MVVSPRSYKRRASTPVISPSLYNSTSGPNEERYLLAEQLSVHSYFMPCTFQITGIVDAVRLEAALQLMNDRHDALRTGFRLDQSGQWFKYVVPYTKARLDIFEIPGADIAQLKLRIHEHFFRKPDFSPESLHGAVLIRRSKLDWVFSFSQHHCISDARSMMIFSRELFALYQGCELSSCPPGYSASLNQQWRSGQNYERSLQFFSKRVSDLGTIAHIVDDRANEAASDAIPSVSILLENELVEAATSAANGAGVTLFTFFYAAVIVLLARATGVATVLTAFQSHGRRNCVDSTECFGPFSNALVVASCLDGAMTMRELLTSVRNDIRSALLHESVPYHHVIRATGIRPLFGINWYPTMPDLRVPGLVLSEVDISDRQSDYDLNFRFVQRAKNLELIIYYRSNGISGDRVQSYAHSLALLSQVLAQDLDAKISASASCD
ncbi:MAG: condensation domain-containing protein, partial [Janthinobacterium lividum]